MDSSRSLIDDIDVVAFADGYLDADPARRDEIARQIVESPDLARRVKAYRAQTAALQRRFDPVIAEAVPDRLYAALDSPTATLFGRLGKIAAMLTLMAGIGATGWAIGQNTAPTIWSAQALVAESFMHDGLMALPSADKFLDDDLVAGAIQPVRSLRSLQWSAGRASMTFRAPDLAPLGYSAVGLRTVDVSGEEMTSLTYESADGKRFNLLLRPRWGSEPAMPQAVEKDGVSLAYWLDGPMAAAIASRLSPQETIAIAGAVQQAMRRAAGPAARTASSGTFSATLPAPGPVPLPKSLQVEERPGHVQGNIADSRQPPLVVPTSQGAGALSSN